MRPIQASSSVNQVEGGLRIPAGVQELEAFRRWSHSHRFPRRGRIDYLQGDIEIDMSPEDLFTHGTAKAAIGAGLYSLIVPPERGLVFIDRARIVSVAAGLSVEPDVVVVLRGSLAAGKVRMIPSAKARAGRYVEMEGAPDLVVEVISDSSVSKDRKRLPRLYAQAGIPELWLVDARRPVQSLEVWSLDRAGCERVPPDGLRPGTWTASPLLGRCFRLLRHEVKEPRFAYHELQSRGS